MSLRFSDKHQPLWLVDEECRPISSSPIFFFKFQMKKNPAPEILPTSIFSQISLAITWEIFTMMSFPFEFSKLIVNCPTMPRPYMWSLFSSIVSVRLSRKQKRINIKTQQATTLKGTWWVIKFSKLLIFYFYFSGSVPGRGISKRHSVQAECSL